MKRVNKILRFYLFSPESLLTILTSVLQKIVPMRATAVYVILNKHVYS